MKSARKVLSRNKALIISRKPVFQTGLSFNHAFMGGHKNCFFPLYSCEKAVFTAFEKKSDHRYATQKHLS
jgi:hypothetical protein